MGLLDELMDKSLDETETAPEFVDYPNGEYGLHITKATAKEFPAKDDKPAGVRVNVIYAITETKQLQDVNQEPAEDGSLNSESFNLNEQGLPYFKRYLVNIFGDTEGVSLGESIQALNGLDITAIARTNDNGYMTTSKQASAE